MVGQRKFDVMIAAIEVILMQLHGVLPPPASIHLLVCSCTILSLCWSISFFATASAVSASVSGLTLLCLLWNANSWGMAVLNSSTPWKDCRDSWANTLLKMPATNSCVFTGTNGLLDTGQPLVSQVRVLGQAVGALPIPPVGSPLNHRDAICSPSNMLRLFLGA